MPRTNYRFPIEYISVEGNETLNGMASIDLLNDENVCLDYPRLDDEYPEEHQVRTILARGVLMGNEAVMLDFHRHLETSSSCSAIVPVGPGSQFARSVPSFILTPVSEAEHTLVLNPTSPSEHAFEGHILYTPLHVGHSVDSSRPFRGALRLAGGVGDLETPPLAELDLIPMGMSIRQSRIYHLPQTICSDLLGKIAALGIRASRFGDRFNLHDVTPDQVDLLPSIDIIVQSDDGSNLVQIGQIEPREYLFTTHTPNMYSFAGRGVDGFVLPRSIIGKLVVHFDYENNRIGFGDPLVEL